MNRRELFGQLAALSAVSPLARTSFDPELTAILRDQFAALDLSMVTLKSDWNDLKSATSKTLDTIRYELGASSAALVGMRGRLTKLEVAQAFIFIWLTALTLFTGLDFITPNIHLL